MNGYAAADEAPVRALIRCRRQQKWKPCQWRRDAPTVYQRYDKIVVVGADIGRACGCYLTHFWFSSVPDIAIAASSARSLGGCFEWSSFPAEA